MSATSQTVGNQSVSKPTTDDVRPVVRIGSTGRLGLIVFFVALVLGGIWIVSLMSEQRMALKNDGPLGTVPDSSARIASPPPLALPRGFGSNRESERAALPRVVFQPGRNPTPQAASPTPTQQVLVRPAPAYTPYPVLEPIAPREPQVTFSAPTTPPVITQPDSDTAGPARVNASRFVNPSRTIPQGTVIPAVLETALDSTRPGGVRALVQRDVHAFDGSRALVPRGSRIYGEYDAQLQRGQNRALIRWTRLIRPDGVTIALDSPASDPLGRAGVKGKVDSKFFQRFGSAILQSVLDIGVGVATREMSDGVIVALPGSTQNVAPRVAEGEIQPTLKVRHGTSVSVFVARDLDFSSVE